MPEPISLLRVQELARFQREMERSESYWQRSAKISTDTATALEALVRLVEAGKAVSAQDAGEGLFSEVDWREMNALTAALAQFTDDREVTA